MSRKILKNLLMGFLMLESSLLIADRDDHVERCRKDLINDRNVMVGRLLWAKKCKFMSSKEFKFAMDTLDDDEVAKKYPTFTAHSGENIAPKDESSSCDGWYRTGIDCPLGCYTPKQRLLFSGEYTSIFDAFSKKQETVSALSAESTVDSVSFKEQKIQHYITGDTRETVYELVTDGHHKLEVTEEHPMVKADGSMIKAMSLKVGDELLDTDARATKIISITTRIYEGKIYNLQPISTHKLENVLAAEGLLTGSNRFQNEWSDLEFRVRLRKNSEIDGL